ncbi:carboxymuconolactone decarboxylase family protein [Camelliibacillus cellulosilyticus]|uniref:Carboxymuconolactone decarboxylase family protein n=1 Tax=Camelliibacillus cellulosilyticus TaxID=2174486 RepID=A0ABV9GK77_9BACL
MEANQETPMTLTEAILMDYKDGTKELHQQLPRVADSYQTFTTACFDEGKLTQKQKQLIALGISLCLRDDTCIVYHTKGCLDQGCSEDEIFEAAGVAAALGGGSAISRGITLIQEAVQELGSIKH